MAKYETKLKGSFDDILKLCHETLMKSISASFEDSSDIVLNGVRVAVRVYERYSMFGKNRVSLNLTLVGKVDDESSVFVTAITSGGSQAVFFKINTFGEENFLEPLIFALKNYQAAGRKSE